MKSQVEIDQALSQAADTQAKSDVVEACRIYRDILRNDPQNKVALSAVSQVLNDLVALYHSGDFELVAKRGVSLKEILPNSAALWNVVAAAEQALGRLEAAARGFQTVVKIKAGDPYGHNNLGVTLDALHENSRSVEAFRRSQIIRPEYEDPYINLASALGKRATIPEAIKFYERALVLNPGNAPARASKLHQQARICDFSWWTEFQKIKDTLGLTDGKIPPFSIMAADDRPNAQKIRAMNWAASLRVNSVPKVKPSANFRKKIRIGYFGADFNEHPVARLLVRMLELHDRDRFDVLVYSYGPNRQDALRERIVNTVDTFHDMEHLSDGAIAAKARDDSVDIAIDLMGYTMHSRPGIFARRCAPTQINYLGYPGTMGAEFIDYIVADPILIPDVHRGSYTEKIICMPDQCHPQDDSLEMGGYQPAREDLNLPTDGFVFCAINNSYKLSPRILDIWVRLLKKTENSVLWLLASNAWVEKNLLMEIEKRDGPLDRVVFAKPTTYDRYLMQFRQADLYLDTFDYNAGATASNALWAGLPVLTKIGQSYPARMAASLLSSLGMPELVTRTEQEYEALALALARDNGRLQETRRTLENNKKTSPLFNSQKYTRDFEALLTKAYNLSCSGSAPEDLKLL